MDWKQNNGLKPNWKTDSNIPTTWEEFLKNPIQFDPALWIYREHTKEQFSEGILSNLYAKLLNLFASDDGKLTFPDEMSITWGPKTVGDNHEVTGEFWYPYSESLWVVWRGNDGQIYMGQSNDTFDDWINIQLLLFIPSGAINPSICFDSSGHFALAVDLTQPGLSNSEVWLLKYPYTGLYINKVGDGSNPKLFLDCTNDLICFYCDDISDPKNTAIYYRCESETFGTQRQIPFPYPGVKRILSLKYSYSPKEDKSDFWANGTLFYKITQESITRYITAYELAGRPYQDKKYPFDSFVGQVSVRSIGWLNVVLPTFHPLDSAAGSVGVMNIQWISFAPVTKTVGDSFASFASVRTIQWISIVCLTKNVSDTAQANVALRSILWIAP